MKRYSVAQARSELPSLIDLAQAGVEVELTRRGVPVAVLLSTREVQRLRGAQPSFRDAYGRFAAKYPLREVGVDRSYPKSVRDRTAGRNVSL